MSTATLIRFSRHLIVTTICFSGLSAAAQGNVSVLINNHVVDSVEGVYEVKSGDKIQIRITETTAFKFKVLRSAKIQTSELVAQGHQGEQRIEQQQQQAQTNHPDDNAEDIPIKYQSGTSITEYKLPVTAEHQINFEINVTYLPEHLAAVRHFRGYANSFKFFLK